MARRNEVVYSSVMVHAIIVEQVRASALGIYDDIHLLRYQQRTRTKKMLDDFCF